MNLKVLVLILVLLNGCAEELPLNWLENGPSNWPMQSDQSSYEPPPINQPSDDCTTCLPQVLRGEPADNGLGPWLVARQIDQDGSVEFFNSETKNWVNTYSIRDELSFEDLGDGTVVIAVRLRSTQERTLLYSVGMDVILVNSQGYRSQPYYLAVDPGVSN